MVRRTCSAWIVLGLAVTACSADDELSGRAPLTPPGRELDDRVGRARAAIIDGVPAPDDDAVVVVSHVEMGELCTGTLVSRRVIVTAKHCTVGAEPSGIAIGFGDTVEQARDATVYSADHRATPGMVIDGQDVAVVVLREDAPVAPVPFSRDAALRPLLGTTVRVVGFGLDELGRVGVRRSVEDLVTETGGAEFATRGPSGCQGDSGGPAFDASGTLLGVVARGLEGCRDRTIFGAIAYWADMVDEAIAASGECIPADETCNGRDDDCDGEPDEGCSAIGEPCTSDDACIASTCRVTSAGTICTIDCDAARPAVGCPAGHHCGGDGCDGVCVPGEQGALAAGSACERDSDCASLRCRATLPSATPVCVEPCERGRGHCVAGLVCAPSTSSTCGSCVAAADGPTPRELGEPCDAAADCASAICVEDACARACDVERACPEGFGCRTTDAGDVCLRRAPEPVGVPCLDDADCTSGICGFVGERTFCTDLCGEDAPCPEGTSCAPAAEGLQACVPERSTVGEPCATDADCLFGACARAGDRGACTRPCTVESPCPAGLSCVPAADGTPICLPPGGLGGNEDCGCSAPGRPRGSVCVLAVLVALASGLLTRAARRHRR